MNPLRLQTIEALAFAISGGSATGHDDAPPFLHYRSGWEIERFMQALQIDFSVAPFSRVDALRDCLDRLNQDPESREQLMECIRASVQPIDYVHERERLDQAVEYLNGYLRFDGWEVRVSDTDAEVVRLRRGVDSGALSAQVKVLNLDTVQRDLDRARRSIETDPEDAITAACSMLESVLRSIIITLGQELPVKKDLASLYKVVQKELRLSPNRSDISSEIAGDVKVVLGGLTSCVSGIAALRTHAGDAHGRERGHVRVDSRIALLAVNAASTLGLFLIETWQMRYPTRLLKSVDTHHVNRTGERLRLPRASPSQSLNRLRRGIPRYARNDRIWCSGWRKSGASGRLFIMPRMRTAFAEP